MTWTGKRVRGAGSGSKDSSASGIGKYMNSVPSSAGDNGGGYKVDEEQEAEHVRKKKRAAGQGGFGNFDSW